MTEQNGTFPVSNEGRLWNRDFVLNLLVAHLMLAGVFALFIVVSEFIVKLGCEAGEIRVIIATCGRAGVYSRTPIREMETEVRTKACGLTRNFPLCGVNDPVYTLAV